MYKKIALDEKSSPTPYEMARLRKSENTARLNNLLLESFDMVTDVAFMLVLFDQGLHLELPQTWYSIAIGSCGGSIPAPLALSDRFLGLAISSAFFLGINVLFRLVTGIWQIHVNRHRVDTGFKWASVVCVGLPMTIIDPWNGALFIDDQFSNSGKPAEVDDYVSLVSELRSDWILLLMENLPQFIIQILYAVFAASNANVGLSAAWFVSTFTTILHMLSQLHEIMYLHYQLPEMRVLAKKLLNHHQVEAAEGT